MPSYGHLKLTFWKCTCNKWISMNSINHKNSNKDFHNFSRNWFTVFININHKASSLRAKAQPAFLKVSGVKDPSSSALNPVKFTPGFSCSPLSPACSSTARLQTSVSRGSSAHVRLATLHGCPALVQGIHRSEKRGQADAITFVHFCGSPAWGLETGTSHSSIGVSPLCFAFVLVCVYERVYVCVIVMTLCLYAFVMGRITCS